MINLDALQKSAELADFSLAVKPDVIIKLIEVARAAKMAWQLLDLIEPNVLATDYLFKALEGAE